MNATVNGEIRQITPGISLQKLLGDMGMDLKYIAVAVNRDFIPRSEYDKIIIKEGDDVEIVSPQAGG
jgi:sulfur carrier protein